MSPKSLLRHPKCVSNIKDFTSKNSFLPLIEDESVKSPRKTLFCSGKIYYDLDEYRQANNITDVAILRVEQLYPLPEKRMREVMKKHKESTCLWVQEESVNNGAWTHIMNYFRKDNLDVIARKASASPATGFKKVHDAQQLDIIKRAFE